LGKVAQSLFKKMRKENAMKTRHIIALLALIFVAKTLTATEIFVINSVSQTLSRIDTENGSVNNSFALLGQAPNLMDMDDQHIYVVCSGDNAIQVLNRLTGAHIRYIPVAGSSNPYAVLKVGEHLYVSGLFTEKLYKISLQTNSVVASVNVGAGPQGLCSDGNRLFVCNTGGWAQNFANSSVSVIDLDSFSVEATIPTWTNPQFARVWDGYLHVSCTGDWSDIQGKLDIINLANLTLEKRLDIGGNPGSLWINPSGIGYIGEGMSTALYSYDANTHTLLHGAGNPLAYEASMVHGNSSKMALLKQNWTSASRVSVYGLDFSPLGSYYVGISSTDMMVAPEVTSIQDDVYATPVAQAYPNPLRRGSRLNLKQIAEDNSLFQLFNVRGQLIQSHQIMKGENSLDLGALPAGLYLYTLGKNGNSQPGKLLLLD
jgi:DNA-binding beta-propeller fold protein YncE